MPSEVEIRSAVLEQVSRRWRSSSNALIVEEFGTHYGAARIDVAVVNGALRGYEIKSSADRLSRLPMQVASFGEVFDYLTVVVARKHLAHCLHILPVWWGVIEAHTPDGRTVLRKERAASRNPIREPDAIAGLLWREELLAALRSLGVDAGFRSAGRLILAQKLANEVSSVQLGKIVRDTIRERQSWRADPAHRPDVGMSPPGHRSSGFLARRIRPPRRQSIRLLG